MYHCRHASARELAVKKRRVRPSDAGTVDHPSGRNRLYNDASAPDHPLQMNWRVQVNAISKLMNVASREIQRRLNFDVRTACSKDGEMV